MGATFSRNAGVVLALLATAWASGCAGDGPEVTSPDLEVREVDVDAGGDGFHLGTSTAPDLVPLLLRDDDRISVRVVDVGEGEAIDAGVPTDALVTDSSVAMSDRWIVVSTVACPGPVVEDDGGFACEGQGRSVVLASPVGDEPAWTEVDLGDRVDETAYYLQIVEVTGDRLLLRLHSDGDDGPPPQVEVDLAAGTVDDVAPFDRGVPRCSRGDEPDLTFPTDQGPTEAIRPGADAPVALPQAVSPLPNLFCWSSGPWLLSGTTLVDLDHPDATPIELDGEGEIGWFGSAGDAWGVAFDQDTTITLQPGTGAAPATIEAPFDRHLTLVADGLVVATYGDDGGGLTGLWTAPIG